MRGVSRSACNRNGRLVVGLLPALCQPGSLLLCLARLVSSVPLSAWVSLALPSGGLLNVSHCTSRKQQQRRGNDRKLCAPPMPRKLRR